MYRSPDHGFIRPYLNTSKRSTTRFSFFAVLLGLVVVLACKHSSYQSPSTSSGPASGGSTATNSNTRSLPYGFKSFVPASGHGEVLIGGMTGNVASAALGAALNSLASYFNENHRLLEQLSARTMTKSRACSTALAMGSRCEVWHMYKPAAGSVSLPSSTIRVFQERLMRSAESMQATSRIIREANAFRQDAMERSSLAWDHYIRGTWPIEDQQTHTRYVPQQDVTALVRQLNESEGYERYHVVPYEQLNR